MATIEPEDVLLVVDVQRDFCRGGTLSVPHGDAVVPVLNRLIPRFSLVVFSRDWHPPDHVSFAEKPEFRDYSWPVHCVRDTPGAAFHPDLAVPEDAIVVNKGTRQDREAYSAFDGTGLEEKLAGRKRIFVGGLATDYCVKATVLTAIREGFSVVVVLDAIRGVDIPPGNADEAIEEMEKAGASLVKSSALL